MPIKTKFVKGNSGCCKKCFYKGSPAVCSTKKCFGGYYIECNDNPCEYCNGKLKSFHSRKNYMVFRVNEIRKNISVHDSYHEESWYIPIDNCPKCGRKL